MSVRFINIKNWWWDMCSNERSWPALFGCVLLLLMFAPLMPITAGVIDDFFGIERVLPADFTFGDFCVVGSVSLGVGVLFLLLVISPWCDLHGESEGCIKRRRMSK